MGFELFIAKRYLRSPRTDRSISVITKVAVGGVAVGVIVLITALSMMNGMEKELQQALRGAESDLTVYSFSSDGFQWNDNSNLIDRIKKTVDIEAYAPYTMHQAMVMATKKSLATLVKGIDIEKESKVIPLKFLVRSSSYETKRDNSDPNRKLDDLSQKKAEKILSKLIPHIETRTEKNGNVRKTKINGIILGSQLAHNLEVGIGDSVVIMSLQTRMTPMGEIPRVQKFEVVGFFETGMPSYDEFVSIIDLGVAQKVFKMEGKISGITLKIKDYENADKYKEKLSQAISFPYFFTTWMENNKNLFAMFEREKLGLAIILTLIILLASFLIVSSLVMLVVEKSKDIAILKAMGAKDSSIRKIFMFQGSFIGLLGTVIGVVLGLIVCWVISRFDIIDIPPGVYVSNRIPMHIDPLQIVVISLISLLICFFVTIIPSRKASNLDPVDGMRNE